MSATNRVRIYVRTSPQVKTTIERAAIMKGVTVSGFVLQTASEAARRVVADDDSLMLLQQAIQSFVATCENPLPPTAALRNLMSVR